MYLINNVILDYNYISRTEIGYVLNEIKVIDLNMFLNMFIINDMKRNKEGGYLLLLINYDIYFIKEIFRLIFVNISNLRRNYCINDLKSLLYKFILITKKHNDSIIHNELQINEKLDTIISMFFDNFFINLVYYYKNKHLYNYETLKLWLICLNQLYYYLLVLSKKSDF